MLLCEIFNCGKRCLSSFSATIHLESHTLASNKRWILLCTEISSDKKHDLNLALIPAKARHSLIPVECACLNILKITLHLPSKGSS